MPAAMTIILNAAAGVDGKEALRERLEALLEAEGRDAKICLAKGGEEAIALAKEAVAKGCPLVVAGGGDGTIGAIASVLLGSDTTLGVIPLGTLNHFALDLQIPLDLEGAVSTLLAGHVVSLDVGEVNGRIFLNNASLGLYPDIVAHRLRHQRHGLGKWPAFCLAALTVLRRFPLLDVHLSSERKELHGRTPFVFVGNNEYTMSGLQIGRRAGLDAGNLSLYTTRETQRWGLLRLSLGTLFPHLSEQPALEVSNVKEAWVETRRPTLRVATDGEITLMTSPLHFRVRPGALHVIGPRPGAG